MTNIKITMGELKVMLQILLKDDRVSPNEVIMFVVVPFF